MLDKHLSWLPWGWKKHGLTAKFTCQGFDSLFIHSVYDSYFFEVVCGASVTKAYRKQYLIIWGEIDCGRFSVPNCLQEFSCFQNNSFHSFHMFPQISADSQLLCWSFKQPCRNCPKAPWFSLRSVPAIRPLQSWTNSLIFGWWENRHENSINKYRFFLLRLNLHKKKHAHLAANDHFRSTILKQQKPLKKRETNRRKPHLTNTSLHYHYIFPSRQTHHQPFLVSLDSHFSGFPTRSSSSVPSRRSNKVKSCCAYLVDSRAPSQPWNHFPLRIFEANGLGNYPTPKFNSQIAPEKLPKRPNR